MSGERSMWFDDYEWVVASSAEEASALSECGTGEAACWKGVPGDEEIYFFTDDVDQYQGDSRFGICDGADAQEMGAGEWDCKYAVTATAGAWADHREVGPFMALGR